MINVEVERNGSESALGVLRRFTKRVQGAGILNKVRSVRYSSRSQSAATRKKRALKGIARREEFNRLLKLGKVTVPVRR